MKTASTPPAASPEVREIIAQIRKALRVSRSDGLLRVARAGIAPEHARAIVEMIELDALRNFLESLIEEHSHN